MEAVGAAQRRLTLQKDADTELGVRSAVESKIKQGAILRGEEARGEGLEGKEGKGGGGGGGGTREPPVATRNARSRREPPGTSAVSG